jgi:hypothetical protein
VQAHRLIGQLQMRPARVHLALVLEEVQVVFVDDGSVGPRPPKQCCGDLNSISTVSTSAAWFSSTEVIAFGASVTLHRLEHRESLPAFVA